MKRNLLPILMIAMVWVASCGRADKSGIAVPKDAAVVVHINAPSLSSKLTWQEIRQTNWFKEMYNEAPDSLAKKLMDDPENSGMNTASDFVFFVRRRGNSGYVVFEGNLKDPAAFEAFNKKVTKGGATTKDGDLNIIKSDELIATWNATRFVYVIDAPGMKGMNAAAFGPNSSNQDGPARLPYDSLAKFAKELYTLKSSDNLTDDDRFNTLLKQSGDVHAWMNAGSLYSDMAGGMLSMMKFSSLLEGNISTFTLNFDNGKITVASTGYYGDELAKIYDKYEGKKLDADALARIPSQNVVAAFALNYPPEGLKEFIKVLGVDGMVNGFLGKEGYSIDEFVKANKGDLLITVSDLTMTTKQDTIPSFQDGGKPYIYTKTNPDMKVLFGVSIGDKKAFDKLSGILQQKFGETLDQPGVPKVTFLSDDKWFAAGNSAEQVQQFIKGGGGTKQAYIDKISGHPMGFYVDLQKILKISQDAATDSLSKSSLATSAGMWQDIIVSGGEIKNKSWSATYEINLIDKSTNSLKQLNQYADKLHANMKAERAARYGDNTSDSTAAAN